MVNSLFSLLYQSPSFVAAANEYKLHFISTTSGNVIQTVILFMREACVFLYMIKSISHKYHIHDMNTQYLVDYPINELVL